MSPDDEVWCCVDPRDGLCYVGPDRLPEARIRMSKFSGSIVARWDSDNLRWIEAPAPTIMVELPLDYVQRQTRSRVANTLAEACRAALEREGLT